MNAARVCAIHQPHYLPWLRYFAKAALADVFILLDDVQFTKNGWQNRNKVKSSSGATLLTVPVRHTAEQLINEVEIASPQWAAKHARTLEMCYGKAPHFAAYWPPLRELYDHPWTRLSELAIAQFRRLCELIGLEIETRVSSAIPTQEEATGRLVELCRAVDAGAYLSGEFASDAYLDPARFGAAGIRLALMGWEAPEYAQLYPRAGFEPDLAIVDLLFNEGPRTLEILRAAARVTWEAAP